MSEIHLITTFLYIIQFLISYVIMLTFITYNYWYWLSILVGIALGRFLSLGILLDRFFNPKATKNTAVSLVSVIKKYNVNYILILLCLLFYFEKRRSRWVRVPRRAQVSN
jgi:uncharacterized membrane protein